MSHFDASRNDATPSDTSSSETSTSEACTSDGPTARATSAGLAGGSRRPPPSLRGALPTRVLEHARGLGFDLAGIADVGPSEHLRFYEAWLEAGHHGSMEYLAREDARRRRADLRRTLETVRSAVVVGHGYFSRDAPGVPDDARRGVVARYARGRDYHRVMGRKLEKLLAWIREEGERSADGEQVKGRIYVDTGPVLERELARRAGLGWFGKNTMLLNPREGSYFFLGVLLLNLDLESTGPSQEDRCGTCSRCLEACPTGALLGRDETGAPVMNARRCISYLTIENRGPIPRELRPLLANRVYGCDICQEVCPFNVRFAEETVEEGYAPRGPGKRPTGVQALPEEDVSAETHPGTEAPSLIELLQTALDESAWHVFSRGSAIRRAGRAGFARNVCVALGNWGSSEAVPILSSALTDPEPLVRAHAAWALGRVDSAEARAALSSRLSVEVDEVVEEELVEAQK